MIPVLTADGVELRLRPAGIGRRIIAASADLLFIMGITTALGTAAALLPQAAQILITTTGGFILFWGYHVWFEVRHAGRSPGKRLTGLRAVDAQGLPLTLPQSMLRSALRLLDLAPVAGGVGLVSIILDSQNRRLGDLVAGTVVIHEQPPSTLPAALAAGRRHNSLATPVIRRKVAARITLEERELLVAFVLRAEALTPEARLRIGEALGERLRLRLELPTEAIGGMSGENLARAVLPLCFGER